jgi:hypothetical protein
LESPVIPTYPGKQDPQVLVVLEHGCRFIKLQDLGVRQFTLFIGPRFALITVSTDVGLKFIELLIWSKLIVELNKVELFDGNTLIL